MSISRQAAFELWLTQNPLKKGVGPGILPSSSSNLGPLPSLDALFRARAVPPLLASPTDSPLLLRPVHFPSARTFDTLRSTFLLSPTPATLVYDNKSGCFSDYATRSVVLPRLVLHRLARARHLPLPGQPLDDYLSASRDVLLDASKTPNGRRSGPSVAYFLLSASRYSLAIYDSRGTCLRHTTGSGYTVRRSQGQFAVTAQRQGHGGRSVGSRIRAREVDRLFGEVYSKIDQWKDDVRLCDTVYFSGEERLWGLVWQNDDLRGALQLRSKVCDGDGAAEWVRVPATSRRVTFSELRHVQYMTSHGLVFVLPPEVAAQGSGLAPLRENV